MKNHHLLIVFCILVFMPGCLMTRDQIREGTSSRPTSQSEVSQAQIKKAEAAAKAEDLEEMVRASNGRIEVLENEINQMKQEELNNPNATAQQDEVDKKFAVFEEALKSLETQIQTLAAEVQNLKTAKSASSGGSSSNSKKKGNFAGAQAAFGSKDWKRAIVGYQKYRDLNPKGKWYAEATYKIGVSFQELSMSGEAKAFYQEVIAKYPKGKHAKKAKYRLKQLK